MARRPPLPQNILDKAIAWIAPARAVQRAQARHQLALAGGYTGARLDRAAMAAWKTSAGSPQTDVINDLPMLRERSADLERNAPVATAVVNTTAVHAVGTGLSMNPQIEADALGLSQEQADDWQQDVRHRFGAWAKGKDCDLSRTHTFYELQDLWLRGTLTRGDIFVVTPMVQRAGQRGTRLALQSIEADRVCNPAGQSDADDFTDGIEHSPETGEALAYHIANRHPADMLTARTWTRRAARGASGRRNVIHLFRAMRPGLRRGVPILAPVIEPLRMISRYTDAELGAAVASGLFPLFATMDPAAFEGTFSDADAQASLIEERSKWTGEIQSMQVTNLLPGEKIESPNPGRPNAQFDPFVIACVKQIGMATGIPYEVLAMHYSSSYTAARGALLMAWRFFNGWREWIATNACQPIYELWLAEEVAAGRIAAPGFFSDDMVRYAWCCAQWVGDGPGSIDPGKEVAAAEARVNLGISTKQAESILHDGVDYETKHRQRVKEIEMEKRDGTYVAPGNTAQQQPAQPPRTAEEDDRDENDDEIDEQEDEAAAPPPPPQQRSLADVSRLIDERRAARAAAEPPVPAPIPPAPPPVVIHMPPPAPPVPAPPRAEGIDPVYDADGRIKTINLRYAR